MARWVYHIHSFIENDCHHRPRNSLATQELAELRASLIANSKGKWEITRNMMRASYTHSVSKTRFLIQPWNEVLILSIGVLLSAGRPPTYRLAISIVLPSAEGPNFISTGLPSSSCMVITLPDQKRKTNFLSTTNSSIFIRNSSKLSWNNSFP